MACPYFYPVEPRSRASDVRDAMLPLGDSYSGFCRALPGLSDAPDEAALRPLCNLGYARGQCARFPAADGPDAVRFTISGASQANLSIAYVVERDHHPFAHGRLEYSTATGLFADSPSDLLARQAQAYAESYRRRKTS
jgi:hypothetical protein